MNQVPIEHRPVRGYAPVRSGDGSIVLVPASIPGRVIVCVHFPYCFSCGHNMIDTEVISRVPEELFRRGLDEATWTKWMSRFDQITKADTLSSCAVVVVAGLCLPIPYFVWKDHNLQVRVSAFAQEFNREVLEPKGMYCKTAKSFVDPDCNSDPLVSWLSIAYTPEEVAILQDETQLWGYDSKVEQFVPLRGNCCAPRTTCNGFPIVI
eukprot:TRINITY_DN13570_c0_g1_i1.p1 TRINITY_DN13570_c0_g1~~TRINITY_DN13570_c0_g1_i1.p1  ORF type:complete len:208 (+),score=23.86 TRINITY_DN13570_c0_g1_i1:55-678(+)